MVNGKTLITFICDADEKNRVERRIFCISDMLYTYAKHTDQQDEQ